MLINLRNALMSGKRLPYDAEVEFLQTDGNAYIATGITPPTGATVKTELTFGFASSSRRRFLFSDSNANATHYCEVNESARYGAGTAYISQTLSADTMYNATATFTSASASYSIDINGTQYTSSTTSYPSSAWRGLVLFRINIEFRGAGQRIGACKIYVNGVLVRDFIPVRVGTVGYLYDRVSGKLFGNAGTGDFVLGPDTPSPV